jgi:hypothetical protein
MKKIYKITIILILAGALLFFIDNDKVSVCNKSYFHFNKNNISGSIIYLIDTKDGKILDSTKISLRTNTDTVGIGLVYLMDKELPFENAWKLVFTNNASRITESVVISDFELETSNQKNMLGNTKICKVYRWKVDGTQYSIDNGDKFILAE